MTCFADFFHLFGFKIAKNAFFKQVGHNVSHLSRFQITKLCEYKCTQNLSQASSLSLDGS